MHKNKNIERYYQQISRTITESICSTFNLKPSRACFDPYLQGKLRNAVTKYAEEGMEILVNLDNSNMPPRIVITFVTNRDYNNDELLRIRNKAALVFKEYLSSFGVAWDVFPHIFTNGMYLNIYLFYCEFETDRLSFESTKQAIIKSIRNAKSLSASSFDYMSLKRNHADGCAAIGFDPTTDLWITVDLRKIGHMCVIGGTGSGKSCAVILFMYNVLISYKNVVFHVADFKKSGFYSGYCHKHADGEEVVALIEEFYDLFENTPEGNEQLQILIIDEYAGLISWLTQNDKKKAEEIKSKISTLLMLGRSRHCYVWCIQQRISANLFPNASGAIDNYQICLGMGKLSTESRKTLFAGEHLDDLSYEANYHPSTGQGLVLIDGQGLKPIQIPFIHNGREFQEELHYMISESKNSNS